MRGRISRFRRHRKFTGRTRYILWPQSHDFSGLAARTTNPSGHQQKSAGSRAPITRRFALVLREKVAFHSSGW
jgi:hypothetical protein